MGVKVKLSGLLRQAADWQEIIEINQYTPLACLKDLEAQFPDIRKWIYDKHGNMWERMQLFINGVMIKTDDLSRPLKDGDELFLLLHIGGG